MEAIGRLAGGVAHDFNNLLVVIGGHGELALDVLADNGDGELRREPARDRERHRPRGGSDPSATRLQPPPGGQPELLDVNEVVADTERLLQRVIGDDVELATELGDGPLEVESRPRAARAGRSSTSR